MTHAHCSCPPMECHTCLAVVTSTSSGPGEEGGPNKPFNYDRTLDMAEDGGMFVPKCIFLCLNQISKAMPEREQTADLKS